jgi:hypothetical protein
MIKNNALALLLFGLFSCSRSQIDLPPVLQPIESQTQQNLCSAPSCLGFPAGLTTHPNIGSNGASVHWDFSTCLPVTYDSALENQKALIAEALNVWSQTSCARVCFGELTVNEAMPTLEDRRIHFTTDIRSNTEIAKYNDALSTINFCGRTGAAKNAVSAIRSQTARDLNKADFIYIVGRALGLESADPDSVLVPAIEHTRETLSPGDEKFLCEYYGPKPFCK